MDRQTWSNLLESLTAGRWRRADLQIRQLLPPPEENPDPMPPLHPDDAIDRAWIAAEAFARTVDQSTGRHCTPRWVAQWLADALLGPAERWRKRQSPQVIDPACGAGALLLASAVSMAAARGTVEWDRLRGYDVDPLAVAMCEAVIWIAAGEPAAPPGRFAVRDALASGPPPDIDPERDLLVANPPWGVKPARESIRRWRRRVGPQVAGLLQGETNIYTLFLLEAVLSIGFRCGFVTPIHWMHRRSLERMRLALAESGRLREVFILRKRVFPAAPDMIPALTVWGCKRTPRAITVRRTGFKSPVPLPYPLPIESSASLTPAEWTSMPYAVLPMLRSDALAPISRAFFASAPRFGDPALPKQERMFHIGDGVYKTHLRGCFEAEPAGLPVLRRAAEVGRYRLDAPAAWLSPAGAQVLSANDSARFAGPMLVMHALKKAAAPWRLAAAHHAAHDGPLVLTNNFLVLVAQRYDGDLAYPLALLNSRLFNRLYTEVFPGVNIEAYTVGSLPLPWPAKGSGAPPPDDEAPPARWYRWSAESSHRAGVLRRPVYEWLTDKARALQAAPSICELTDLRMEAVICGLFQVPNSALLALLQGAQSQGDASGAAA